MLRHEKSRSAVEAPPIRFLIGMESSTGHYAITILDGATDEAKVQGALGGEWLTASEICTAAGIRRGRVEEVGRGS